MPRLPMGGLLRAAKRAGRAGSRGKGSKRGRPARVRPWNDHERRRENEIRKWAIEQWRSEHPDGPDWT
jgi:hypothetical protein